MPKRPGLREGEFCVFFRNNHFSVLHKHNGSLFLLVTDVGYQGTPVVWEKLDQVINFLSFFPRVDGRCS
jgi:hypothetical protein